VTATLPLIVTLLIFLQALFEIFFRVLKHCSASTATTTPTDPNAAAAGLATDNIDSSSSSSKGVLVQPWAAAKVHRKFPLLQPTLAGLGRYSHLISVDYFNDLMAVLQEVCVCIGGGGCLQCLQCMALGGGSGWLHRPNL
jgi:nucleolar complex protein 3